MTDIQNEINHLKSKIYVIDLLHQGEQVEERALYMKQLQELESLKIEELVQAAVKLCDYCCKQKCNKCIFYHTSKHYCMLREPKRWGEFDIKRDIEFLQQEEYKAHPEDFEDGI